MHMFSALVLALGLASVPAPVSSVTRDAHGVPHLRASTTHDLFYLQGWTHAEDRLFQMDVTRRRASGTLAELLGPSALPGDVQMRTLGLRRAAERTAPLLSPATIKTLTRTPRA